jgi:hypothetical protein
MTSPTSSALPASVGPDVISGILAKAPPGVSRARIAAMAGFHVRHLRQMESGSRRASTASVARLRLAITRMKAGRVDGPPEEFALYSTLLALASLSLGLDPAMVAAQKPAAKQVMDDDWRAAAGARWLAQYLMNCGFGLKQAAVARACGMTRQAVSLAMQEVELRRETDPEFEALVSRLEVAVQAVV